MIGIHSVRSLKAETQRKCFDKIVLLLHEVGFNVIGICVDNAVANKKILQRISLWRMLAKLNKQYCL